MIKFFRFPYSWNKFEEEKKMFLDGEEDSSMCSEKPTVDDFLVYTDPKHSTTFFDKLYDLYTRCELCDVRLCVDDKTISACLLYTSPSPRDKRQSRMPSSA